MIKDLLSTIEGVTMDTNLKPSEKILLIYLIKNYNAEQGYAYPNYEHIKIALSTKRNQTVSDTLKALVEKGYITIGKVGHNKNIYYIHRYLFLINKGYGQGKTINKTYSKRKSTCKSTNNIERENNNHIGTESLTNGKVININISI